MGRGRWVRLDPITPMTDEPGLRAALYETAQEAHDALVALEDGHLDHSAIPWTACPAPLCARARAALTPAASDGSLDVARLARALFRGDIGCEGHGNRTRHLASDHKEDAAFIAAEYARLSESPSEGKTE